VAITVDTTAPSVVLSSAAPDPTNTSPIAVTVVFSESVTGLGLDDFVVANGAVSALSGAGSLFDLTVVPAGQGTVSVSVAAEVCQDAAGNGCAASLPLTRAFDTVSPELTGLADDPAPVQSKTWTWAASDADPLVVHRHAFDQVAGGVPSGAYGSATTATLASADGTWYLHVQARDRAGNESAIATVSVLLDNTAPALAISAPRSSQEVQATTVLVFTDNEQTAPQASVDGAHWAAVVSGVTALGSIPGHADLPPGPFILQLRDTDAAGNAGVATQVALINALPVVPPDGEFRAQVDATGVAAGRGWWDLSGIYSTSVAGYPLVLDLMHDAQGKLTGTATYTVAKDAPVVAAAKGTVKGTSGNVAAKVTMKGTNPERTVSVSLALNLTVDAASLQLTGALSGKVTTAGAVTPVFSGILPPIPTPMDGAWTLLFVLAQGAKGITSTAVLTLSIGADCIFLVKGRTGANSTAILSLAGDPANPAAKALKIKTTIASLEGGWARIASFSAKGYGQTLAW
jgi:hypothetical protein